jgi:gliding motility-associated transport system ATP-binding protein
MLDVRGLSRYYGNFKAVDDVSFTMARGEIVGLLGHNGAGKTTIMKMLSGNLEPHAGRVLIDGSDLAADTKRLQIGLGYLPESLPVYPEMVVADYLDYAAEIKSLRGELKTAEIRRALAATGIEDKLLAPIATLSRGYKQRVGVAQAILGRPRLLILDEPTNGLDPTQTEHMRELIRELAREATVILSTHIMQEVEALCDRVLIVRGGRLAVDAQLATLRQSNQLQLDCSLSGDTARAALAAIPGVAGATPPQAGCPHWLLQLETGADARATCAAVARLVGERGAELYRLQPEQRDLETLFRTVNATTAGEGLSHAA